MQWRITQSLRPGRNALASRIAADDAKYRGLGEADDGKRAHHAEKQLAMETAQLAEAQAQRELLLAIQQLNKPPDKADEAMKAEVRTEALQSPDRTDAAQALRASGD